MSELEYVFDMRDEENDETEDVSAEEKLARAKERYEEKNNRRKADGDELLNKYVNSLKLFLNEPNRRNDDCPYFPEYKVSYFENCIGKRLQYLTNQRGMKISELVSYAHINRTNYYRILNGETVPRTSTLLTILDVLDISPFDFCYPVDFNDWMWCAPTMLYSAPKDIFEVREAIREQLKGRFFYYQNGNKIVLSGKYYSVFMDAIESAFRVLDLIPHDTARRIKKREEEREARRVAVEEIGAGKIEVSEEKE